MKLNFLFSLFIFASTFLSRFNLNIVISWHLVHLVIILLTVFIFLFDKFTLRRGHKSLFFLFTIFVLYFSLTALWADEPLSAIKMLLGMAFCWLAFLVAMVYFNKLDAEDLKKIFYVVGSWVCIGSLFFYFIGLSAFYSGSIPEGEVIWGVMVEKSIPRMVGLQSDPNFMAFVSLLFVFFFSCGRDKKSKALAVIYFFILVATLSRSGVLAFGFGGLIYFLLSRKKIAFLLYLFISILPVGYFLSRSELLIDVIDARISGLGTGGGRFQLWSDALKLFLDDPLFGVGIFQFRSEMSKRFGSDLYAHNTYLELLVEAGVIGFVLFSVFLIYFYCSVLHGKDRRWILPSISALLVMMLSLSVVAHPFIYISIALFLVISFPGKFKSREMERLRFNLN